MNPRGVGGGAGAAGGGGAQGGLAGAVDNPQVFIQGTQVAASATSTYRVELLVEGPQGLVPPAVENDEGLAFVDIGIGQSYVVRVHNNSPFDAAVRLTIDGLNCFEFSQNAQFRKLGMWIVRANSTLDIRGWYIDRGLRQKFTIVPTENSAASELGADQSLVGTVTCQFFAAWPVDQPKPPIEPAGARGGKGTGRGATIEAQREAQVERFIGKTLQAAVSVRYDKPDPNDLPLE